MTYRTVVDAGALQSRAGTFRYLASRLGRSLDLAAPESGPTVSVAIDDLSDSVGRTFTHGAACLDAFADGLEKTALSTRETDDTVAANSPTLL